MVVGGRLVVVDVEVGVGRLGYRLVVVEVVERDIHPVVVDLPMLQRTRLRRQHGLIRWSQDS